MSPSAPSGRSVRRTALLSALVVAPLVGVPAAAVAQPPVAAAPVSVDAPAAGADREDTGPVQRRVPAAQRAAAAAVLSAGAEQAAPTQFGATTCAVGGIVWDDTNQNGLQTGGETPVQGAAVVLRYASDQVAASTTSGADGRYLFDGVVCGSYHVAFSLPDGYQWTAPGAGDGSDDSQAEATSATFVDGITPLFTIAPGQPGVRQVAPEDGLQAAWWTPNVDAGVIVQGSAPYLNEPAPAEPAPAEPAPAEPAPAEPVPAAPVPTELAQTGTATENVGWTGAALLVVGAGLVVGTRRRPEPVRA